MTDHLTAEDAARLSSGETRPPTLGDLGRAIGRYTESEGGDSAETLAAHRGLFAIYDRWVDAGRPEIDAIALSVTDEQVHAVLARGIADDALAEGSDVLPTQRGH